jgi:hypothetical protein
MKNWIVAGAMGISMAAPAAPEAKAPAQGACGVVTSEEAAAVLGSAPKATASGSACTYQVPGESLQLVVRRDAWSGETEGGFRIFQLQQTKMDEGTARKADPAMQAEPSFGAQAVSVRAKDSFYLLAPAKKTLLELEVRDSRKSLAASAPEKLRGLARKVADRQ